MKAEEIFKDQLERRQKVSSNVGTKTYFGKELQGTDHILYFIHMKNEGVMELSKACTDELELFDSQLERVVNKDGSSNSLLGALPVFKNKPKK